MRSAPFGSPMASNRAASGSSEKIVSIMSSAMACGGFIEINPRMAPQFTDLYEKVDGVNSYEILFALSLGDIPRVKKGQGKHSMAASCVLRTFENALVAQLPSAMEIERLRQKHPDVRVEILATEGLRLSRMFQDGYSYRYGLLNIGGRDLQDILSIQEECLSGLTFRFNE
jgi:hypothetical protein